MAKYLIAAGYSTGTGHIPSTAYVPLIGYIIHNGTEDRSQILARSSYTLSNLYVYIRANTVAGASTVVSRIQTPPNPAANGNQLVSIPAGTTGAFTDAVNSDNLVDGDLFCTRMIVGGSGSATSISETVFSCILSAVDNTSILATFGLSFQNANLTRYILIGGAVVFTATETNTYYTFRTAAILSNLRCHIATNTITGNSTLITRIDGGAGGQSITIPAGSTGVFEDTTGTDNVTPGQNVNYQLVTGAGSQISVRAIQVKTNSVRRQVCANDITASVTVAFGSTRHAVIEGWIGSSAHGTNEADVQTTARAALTAKNMYVNVSSNSLDGTTTLRVRKNVANGNMLVSVGAGATGQFEDLVNIDRFIASDNLNWITVAGGTVGAITVRCMGFEMAQVVGPFPTHFVTR